MENLMTDKFLVIDGQEYKVRDDVPLNKSKDSGAHKYAPIRRLKVGESILVKTSLAKSIYSWAKYNKIPIATRSEGKKGSDLTRVFKVRGAQK